MIFRETKLAGVFNIVPEPTADERGFFARTWCAEEFAEHGLSSKVVQCSVSCNTKTGTLRGLHYQEAPHAEIKIVRCTQGAIFDVAVDLRPDSLTFRQWIGVTLTAATHEMLYIPVGCAHGFLTLEDNTEILYQMSEFYHPESAHGARWDDPAFQITWPAKPTVISERDRTYPDFHRSDKFV